MRPLITLTADNFQQYTKYLYDRKFRKLYDLYNNLNKYNKKLVGTNKPKYKLTYAGSDLFNCVKKSIITEYTIKADQLDNLQIDIGQAKWLSELDNTPLVDKTQLGDGNKLF